MRAHNEKSSRRDGVSTEIRDHRPGARAKNINVIWKIIAGCYKNLHIDMSRNLSGKLDPEELVKERARNSI